MGNLYIAGKAMHLVSCCSRKGCGRIMRSVKIWWSLWRFAVPTVLNAFLSLACYFIGWHLSCASSALPFARAGAAATVFAIGFTLYDYRSALQKSEDDAASSMRRVTSKLALTGAASQQRIEVELERNTNKAVNVSNWINAIVLMLATFIWGFGDLATRWM